MLTWIGHFHPLILHLPIGLTTAWFVLEFWPKKQGSEENSRDGAIKLVAIFTALSAIAAAVTGFVLADGKPETFSGETVDQHRIFGIAFGSACVVTTIAWYLLNRRNKVAHRCYRILLLVTAVLLGPTGHLGGSLTHGEDYLTKDAPDFVKQLLGETEQGEEVRAMNEDSRFFEAVVEPVLMNRCYACHAGSKREGGVALKPQSQLSKYLGEGGKLLPALDYPIDHKLHMPPRGKTQLMPDEIALLRWYSTAGIKADATVAEVELPEDIAHLDDHLESQKSSELAIDKNAVRELVEAQVYVHPVANGSSLLWIDAAASAPRFDEKLLEPLKALSENIQWLNLARTGLDDRALELAASCENLEELDLSGCEITNDGLKLLADHPKLRRLVLVRTSLNDSALPILANFRSLEKVSLWNSGISEEARKSFASKYPDISLDQIGASESFETAIPPVIPQKDMPKPTELGEFEYPLLDSKFDFFVTVDFERPIPNDSQVTVNYEIGDVLLKVKELGAGFTPFLVKVLPDHEFVPLAIGTRRDATTLKIGDNRFSFVEGDKPLISLEPGESMAIAWQLTGGRMIPFTQEPAKNVWISFGNLNKGAAAKLTPEALVPGHEVGLFGRTYAFALEIAPKP